MKYIAQVNKQRSRRRFRVRNKIRATTSRPRVSVYRSNKHIYAQIIDDVAGRSLISASTREAGICADGENGGNVAAASKVGEALAKKALEAGITQVAFDRGLYKYHGRVAALADAARQGGLDF
ncbi:50S ribosomal protein L18 [Symmachiella macrocystis]|uniref:Large ribosomal subunit protein uL18 n=1 Tax=Symmachiella macrocystis TaxID=2527985 RepID=A0A5C6BQ83_9PLAN|nr:50S ribosomal protein L18 [Symmachiella macrocystis]TWU13852.1 50S ribosomal protein L18 [Symmachiella macrocystis]